MHAECLAGAILEQGDTRGMDNSANIRFTLGKEIFAMDRESFSTAGVHYCQEDGDEWDWQRGHVQHPRPRTLPETDAQGALHFGRA